MQSRAATMAAAAAATGAIALVSIGATGPAAAGKEHRGSISPTPDRDAEGSRAALRFARAIAVNPKVVRKAFFSTIPPFGAPAAVSSKKLAGFPRHGKTFGILSTGDARKADDPNSSGSSGESVGGPSIRGARDVTIVRIELRVPRKANCLSLRFRFLSEEFPEFVDSIYNDAFIAELGESSWTASDKEDPSVTAPANFARDVDGNPIRVNRLQGAFSAESAGATTYDGATRRLQAATRVKPGRQLLYLSIFDQGDREFDSAVFIDRLHVSRSSKCVSGAVPD